MEEILNSAIRTLLVLVLPVAGAATLTGVIVGVLMSATAIQDGVVAYACKLCAICAVLYLLFPLYRDTVLRLFQIAYQP